MDEVRMGNLATEEMMRLNRERMDEVVVANNQTDLPTIHVVSDSVGVTAQTLARAAAAQFGETNPVIETLPKVRSFSEIERFLEEHARLHEELLGSRKLLVFYTLVDRELSRELADYAARADNIVAVDLLTHAIDAVAEVSGREPLVRPGSLHVADSNYFRRIEAVEFAIAHDDGRNPHELTKADIVLIGVSRTSKTPLSIYLSQQGYKVANVPLDTRTAPPVELEHVERTRLFGLMTTAEVLINIRKRRLGSAGTIAASYADPEYVYQDLEQARSLMRKLGCIVIHTENKAVEETAQEILRYYDRAHPGTRKG